MLLVMVLLISPHAQAKLQTFEEVFKGSMPSVKSSEVGFYGEVATLLSGDVRLKSTRYFYFVRYRRPLILSLSALNYSKSFALQLGKLHLVILHPLLRMMALFSGCTGM